MRRVICRLSTFGFNMMPAPAVQAFCYIPRINHSEWVDFMVDTGASETCLNGIYALDLQSQMRTNTLINSCGIGGDCDYFHERAAIIFSDDRGELLSRVIWIGIQHITSQHLQDSNIMHVPCLLGRDILNRCQFDYNPTQSNIALIFR